MYLVVMYLNLKSCVSNEGNIYGNDEYLGEICVKSIHKYGGNSINVLDYLSANEVGDLVRFEDNINTLKI